MKLTVNRSELVEACKVVQSGSNGKSGMAILANVKMVAKDGELTLTTTNSDIELQTSLSCKVIKEGETTVPMRVIMSVANALPEGDISIESDDNNKMHVNGGSANFTIGGMNTASFPVSPVIKNVIAKFSIGIAELRDMLRKTSFAASNDETRRSFSCVLFDVLKGKLRCVATDGRRLAMAERDVKGIGEDVSAKISVPRETIANVLRTATGEGDVEIEFGDGKIMFSFDGTRKNVIKSKVVDSVYPNYEIVIPKNFEFEVGIDRKKLIDSVSRVAIMSSVNGARIKMTFSENQLIVDVTGDDYCNARDALPINNSGAKFSIVFDPRFILEPLKAMDADTVNFRLTNGMAPAGIRADGECFFGVVMPMRDQN